jgi:hypothetical protein
MSEYKNEYNSNLYLHGGKFMLSRARYEFYTSLYQAVVME